MPSTKDCCEFSSRRVRMHNLNLSKNPAMSGVVSELPFDIITEILSWLPVESLLRFKFVCKQWCSLLLDYKFIAKHMLRARPLQLSCQRMWEHNKTITFLYDENVKRVTEVAGLFLEESHTTRVFRIRNFATHQVLYLPYAGNATTAMGFVFDSSTGECKVACFNKNEEVDFGREVGVKVLSIGKDDQWRTLKPPNQNDKLFLKRYFRATHEEGAAHLVEIIRDGEDFKLEVQSFDLWSECFTITTLPRGAFLDLKRVGVFRWNQYVAVADIVGEALNVLVLQDFKEHKWSKITVPLKFLKDDPVLKDQIKPRRANNTFGELQLHNAVRNNLLLYDMKREMVQATINITNSSEKIFTFHKPSLVTLKGMKREYI
ncbi:hypothetical protein ABKV19_005872 [Rosa sericea]